MDGTFLNNMMDYNRSRFRNLYEKMKLKNIKFVIASGNQYYQLKSYFKDYPELLYIAENGAYIRSQAQVYQETSFSSQNAEQILEKLTQIPKLQVLVCGEMGAYYLSNAEKDFIILSHKYYPRLEAVRAFDMINDHILKFALSCSPEETEDVVLKLRKKLKGIAEPTSSGRGGIDIIQPGMNKAAGLRVLGGKFGIPFSKMCAFGDGGNDLEMLSEVGEGVAMENASSAVKKITSYRTASNEEQGVLSYVEEIVQR